MASDPTRDDELHIDDELDQGGDRDVERTYSRAQFVAKLRRLADAIEAERAFTIQVAGERLRIPADAGFNVEHEREGGESELEFQLRWRAAD
jgi:amphi-Trp domain-containing protein